MTKSQEQVIALMKAGAKLIFNSATGGVYVDKGTTTLTRFKRVNVNTFNGLKIQGLIKHNGENSGVVAYVLTEKAEEK